MVISREAGGRWRWVSVDSGGDPGNMRNSCWFHVNSPDHVWCVDRFETLRRVLNALLAVESR